VEIKAITLFVIIVALSMAIAAIALLLARMFLAVYVGVLQLPATPHIREVNHG